MFMSLRTIVASEPFSGTAESFEFQFLQPSRGLGKQQKSVM